MLLWWFHIPNIEAGSAAGTAAGAGAGAATAEIASMKPTARIVVKFFGKTMLPAM